LVQFAREAVAVVLSESGEGATLREILAD